MSVASSPSDDPAGSGESGKNRPLDLYDSSAEEMIRFLKRQPAKYFYSFIGVLVGLLVAVAGGVWLIASSAAESTIVGLRAELSAANQIGAFLRQDIQSKATDHEKAQQVIQSLQSALAEKDRKLVAAQGCESVRADFRRTMARAEELNQKAVSAQGLEKQKIEAALEVLDGTAQVLNGSMNACAGR